MPEEHVSPDRDTSREPSGTEGVKTTFEREEEKIDCYTQCMKDLRDVRDERMCASVCEL